MPRVKFDYVVSFSSEDPENRAANLLAGEVSKKKWLCTKGEPSCSVVLQLPRAIEISAVHIGAYHAALVEVLVGLSERPSDPFQVLVPSCVFVPPAQSRRNEGVDRVRSFTGAELAADTRGKRYDRVRVVCSQPYNKHCQYGLSFIHIHEPENRNDPSPAPPALSTAVPSRMFGLGTYSSDEEEFRPGELFAKHLKSPSSDNSGTTIGAQIRQATSHALKNILDSSTKLLKTPISKGETSRQKQTNEAPSNRQRDSIMYTDDDDKPHAKIDRVVNRHKDEKTKEDELNKMKNIDKDKNREKTNRTNENTKNKERNNTSRENSQKDDDNNKFHKTSKDSPDSSANRKRQRETLQQQRKAPEPQSNKKRKRNDDDDDTGPDSIGAVCDDQSLILRDVTLALSGYEGARRARARDTALALGARYSPDWNARCTHLICAFPNTPKLRTARASGAHIAVATADWLDECLRARRRLPWRWYATIPAERTPVQPLPKEPEPETVEESEAKPEQDAQDASSDRNTDDEIENAMEEIAARQGRVSSPTDVCFVKDERFKGHVTLLDSDEDEDTEIEDYTAVEEHIDMEKALPDFFDGYTFVISDEVVNNGERELLARYVRAFGGLLIQESEIDEDTKVDYVIGAQNSTGDKGHGGVRVRPSWVWDCGRERRLCAIST